MVEKLVDNAWSTNFSSCWLVDRWLVGWLIDWLIKVGHSAS